MNKESFSQFTNLYPVSKTLRFELKPQGRTLEYIEKNGLLEQDEQRAENYKKAKNLIDAYHKHYIDEALRSFPEDARVSFVENLEKYCQLAAKTDPTLKKKKKDIQQALRKTIAGLFDTTQLKPALLLKDNLVDFLYECEHNGRNLPDGLSIDDCKAIISQFDSFATYFEGFRLNRENMYSDEAKATSIANRLVHENLPKFLGNMEVWNRVKDALHDQLPQLEKDMSHELQGHPLAYYFEELASYAGCLAQYDIDRYNTLIGGRTEEDCKVQGINEYINLYNQKAGRKERLPKMTRLYKMILSDRESLSWLPESFCNDNQLLEAVVRIYNDVHEAVFDGSEDNISLKGLLASLSSYDASGIFIRNDAALTSVLKQACGEWNVMVRALEAAYDKAHPLKDPKKLEKHEESRRKWINSFDSFSLADISHYLESDMVTQWYENLWCKEEVTAFERVEQAYAEAKDLLNTEYTENLKNDAKNIEKLKSLLDALKDLQRLAATLQGSGDESSRDGRFYADWDRLTDVLNQLTSLYNMVRNYVTQKPYSEEKFKLNFENPQLLAGWDLNKEAELLGILLRKEGMYYLGIMDRKHRKLFNGELSADGICYEKVDYKTIKDVTTMVPKCTTQLKSVKAHFATSDEDFELDGKQFIKSVIISKEIFELNNKTYNGKKKFQLEYLRNTGDQVGYDHAVSVWIHFCLDFLSSYASTSIYDLDAFSKKHFSRIDEFYKEINTYLYKLSFRPVSAQYIDTLVNSGQLYLFQIYNKDFSEFSKGTPNMHTLYWKALFSEENLRDVVYKLNGGAEVFFRRKSVSYDEQHQREGYHHEKLKDRFAYPIYKDRRYSVDKFQFHVPITMNFKAEENGDINQQAREFVKAGGIEHIIGIDRGERHLLYVSVIDLQGNIVKQLTLNEITNEYKGQAYKTDYHALLDKKESDRDAARKNWQTIEGIKDLKEGYLSQAVHVITQLMVQYKAIVVLEDLNLGFMRGRQKVEKQVYQKFEKMLIDKLNYLVDKKLPANAAGGLMHALQLTSEFTSFQKLGKQCGFLFYVPASLTSKIDPVTGFANYISAKYENREKARDLFGKFADIRFNADKDYFEFLIDDYRKFNPKAAGRQQWTLCSYGPRIRTFRNPDKNNEWDNAEVQLTSELKHLFDTNGIDYRQNLLAQILFKDDAAFFENLLHLLGLLLQMRNSITGTTRDFIISPVADEQGRFYCSDHADPTLPHDADANGAFNIARKGLWAVLQMQQADDPAKANLAMSNEQWMLFAQEKTYKK